MPATQRMRGAGRIASFLAAVLLAGSVLTGCSSIPGGDEPGAEVDVPAEGLAVTVHNQNWATIHCYVVLGSRSVSLGQVSTNREETFTVGPGVLGPTRSVRLLADPVGSTDTYLSEPILIEPGDRIEWTLRNPLSQSSIHIY